MRSDEPPRVVEHYCARKWQCSTLRRERLSLPVADLQLYSYPDFGVECPWLCKCSSMTVMRDEMDTEVNLVKLCVKSSNTRRKLAESRRQRLTQGQSPVRGDPQIVRSILSGLSTQHTVYIEDVYNKYTT